MNLEQLKSMEAFNTYAQDYLPGLVGMEITSDDKDRIAGRLPIRKALLAPNGYLHAASVIALADTLAGFACIINLPEDAQSFTTIELKSNFLGTARTGVILGEATPLHRGRTTHVWDSRIWHEESDKTIAEFRCTQMLLRKQT